MDPITGAALASGAASALGGFLGNSSAKREALRNRNFQSYMSNTAHQREVKDLRAAGLNPILSATGGQGASSPAGSMAPISTSIGSDAVSGYNSAKQLQLATAANTADVSLKNAQTTGAVQSAKESMSREAAIAQETGINKDKYKFEKEYREMDKYLDRTVKASAIGSNLSDLIPGSAKKLAKPLFDKATTKQAEKLLRHIP